MHLSCVKFAAEISATQRISIALDTNFQLKNGLASKRPKAKVKILVTKSCPIVRRDFEK